MTASLRCNPIRERISQEKLNEAFSLYQNQGWKLLWIAKKLGLHHTILRYHIIKRQLIRNVSVLEKRPIEVDELYKSRSVKAAERKINIYETTKNELGLIDDEDDFDAPIKSYHDIMLDSLKRRHDHDDTECSHPYWIKRCSLCKAILESDTQLNQTPSTEPVRFVYNEFDKIICTYHSSLELQKMGVRQDSMLYWVYYDDRNMYTIRVKTNLPDSTDDNAIPVSAFTAQELFKLLLRLPSSMRDNSFILKLALNGDNPTYLAKLLIRCLKKLERTKLRRRGIILDRTLLT